MKPLLRLVPFALLTAATACGGSDKAALTPASLSTPEPSYLFDTLTAPSWTHDFVITNQGEHSTALLISELTGDLDEFRISKDKCMGELLPPNVSCKVTVELSAGVAGSFAAQLHVSSDSDFVDVAISGRVTACRLVATAPAMPTHVLPGQTAYAMVTVTNAGADACGPLTITGDASHPISSNECQGMLLASSQKCTFAVSDAPPLAASGTDSADVTVAESLGSSTSLAVPFVIDQPTAQTLQLGSGDFGAQDPAAANAKILMVYNPPGALPTGKLSLTIAGGSDPTRPAFPFIRVPLASGCDGTVLTAGAVCYFGISIDPTAPAPALYHAIATVSQAGGPSATVPLTVQTATGHVLVQLTGTGSSTGYIVTPWSEYTLNNTGVSSASVTVAVGYPTLFNAAWDGTTSMFTKWTTGPCAGSTSGSCVWTPTASDSGVVLTAQFDKK